MSTTRKRRSRRGWDKPGDALVPIVGERVLAALDADHLTITDLAQQIRDSQQTVSLICRGVTKRTRRFRVKRMAKVFDLPPEWLMGSMKELPGLAGWTGAHLYTRKGDLNHPAAWQLAIGKWETQVEKAYVRDHKGNRPTRFDHFLRERFTLAFMIHPGVWRDLLFESPDWRELGPREDPLDQDVVHGTKNGRKGDAIVRLSPEAYAWAKRAVPCPVGASFLSHQWKKACRAAGRGDVRLYDLRHCTAQWLTNAGRSLDQVQQTMRHKSLEMTARYARRKGGCRQRGGARSSDVPGTAEAGRWKGGTTRLLTLS